MRWARHCAHCGRAGVEIREGRSYACPGCGFLYYHNVASGVSAVLRQGDRIAFVTRAEAPGAGLLDLPGGFVDPGETLEAAIVREIREELGLVLPPGRYLFSAANDYPFAGVDYSTVDAYFEFEMAPAEVALDAAEIAALHWLRPDDVAPETLAFESVRTAVARLLPAGAKP